MCDCRPSHRNHFFKKETVTPNYLQDRPTRSISDVLRDIRNRAASSNTTRVSLHKTEYASFEKNVNYMVSPQKIHFSPSTSNWCRIFLQIENHKTFPLPRNVYLVETLERSSAITFLSASYDWNIILLSNIVSRLHVVSNNQLQVKAPAMYSW